MEDAHLVPNHQVGEPHRHTEAHTRRGRRDTAVVFAQDAERQGGSRDPGDGGGGAARDPRRPGRGERGRRSRRSVARGAGRHRAPSLPPIQLERRRRSQHLRNAKNVGC